MIIPEKHRILIVPDFGTGADDGEMLALKEAIEVRGEATVIVANLRKMVLDEHPDKALKEADVIELAARKLESLASDNDLNWGPYADDCPTDPIHELCLDEEMEFAMDDFDDARECHQAQPRTIRLDRGNGRALIIHVSKGSDDVTGTPHSIVVFGRSAMLADGVGKTNVLFVDPVYDSEWPWKKLYYAGRDAAYDFFGRYVAELNEPDDIQVLWTGTEVRRRPERPMRYGIFTGDNNSGVFHDRYLNLEMTDRELDGNTEKLAKTICEFNNGKMEFPLLEIYDMVNEAAWECKYPEICSFDKPLDLGGVTATGLVRGVPMANGQSGIRLRVAERSYGIPLEGFSERKHITALRDAVADAVKKFPEKKRILLVPDYFAPCNAPSIIELRDRLSLMGYYVAVFAAGNTLTQSQKGIERRCKVKPFDLIITIETGCLLASRIVSAPRIFVNPDWTAWEWMKITLGEDKEQCRTRGLDNSGPSRSYFLNREEIAEALKMGERSYIRRGQNGVYGLFSEDSVESHITEEHTKRFNSCCYIPHLRLDTEEGIHILANEIDKIIKTDEE